MKQGGQDVAPTDATTQEPITAITVTAQRRSAAHKDEFSRMRLVKGNIMEKSLKCHYPVPQVSVSLSCTPSVSVIILYPQCQCHYLVPRVSVSSSCTPSVSVIILYPQCQCHYPVP
ncbi:unnamed protein product [Ranitomeya imitator]|uniref:Uncharacterized protein n=1 Tax=Ranitomeya imitator TaxID=111125 RepID=A0ABN9LMV9_9NEOB|nr:unnamed protein product [Ranitomeya imitator]